jgi:uncharacterized protein YigE (DUF2233 family)
MLHLVKKAAAGALLACLLLTACREQDNSGGNAFDPAKLQETAACDERRFEGSRFTVCAYDARRDEVRLAWRGADG